MSQARTHDTLVLFEPYNKPLMFFAGTRFSVEVLFLDFNDPDNPAKSTVLQKKHFCVDIALPLNCRWYQARRLIEREITRKKAFYKRQYPTDIWIIKKQSPYWFMYRKKGKSAWSKIKMNVLVPDELLIDIRATTILRNKGVKKPSTQMRYIDGYTGFKRCERVKREHYKARKRIRNLIKSTDPLNLSDVV